MADAPLPVVEPKEALAFFRGKSLTQGFAWQDVWQEEHARAFTVAKAMNRDLLEDIRGAVDGALAEGRTLKQFQDELRPLLEAKGWWGRKPMIDPLTGERKIVQLGSPRRLRTIFEVNMRSAYAAGRWERAQRNKEAFPFLRYVTAGDSRVRPEHQSWNGVIRPIDDPFWDTHYPPCGWSCRCTAVPVSRGQLRRRGLEVTEDPPSYPKLPYTNPRTGEVTRIERGIDPGFNFNIGKAYQDSLGPRPIPPPSSAAPPAAGEQAFFDAFGVDGSGPGRKTHVDQGGWPLAIGPGWFRRLDGKAVAPGSLPADDRRAAELLGRVGAAIVNPDEIRTTFVDGKNGEKLWTRRYLAGRGRDALLVEVSRAGWRFLTPGDPAWSAKLLRGGERMWKRQGEQADLAELVGLAARERDPRASVALAAVGGRAPAELHGLRREIRASELRHMLKVHGDPEREARRGQLAITAYDLRRIPQIIAAADRVSFKPAAGGMPGSLTHEATIEGVRYFYVERIGGKSGQVAGMTLYKRKVEG